MSTRTQRRDWETFRKKFGATEKEFKKKWKAQFGREPNEKELRDYRAGVEQWRTRRKGDDRHPIMLQPVHLTKRYEWDMAHRLPAHEGKCRRLHGHRYIAEVTVTGPVKDTPGSDNGMVLDFGMLKDALERCIGEPWDHRTMLWEGDELSVSIERHFLEDESEESLGVVRVPFIPTAENLAREVMLRLDQALEGFARVTVVRIYETPTGWAEVRSAK